MRAYPSAAPVTVFSAGRESPHVLGPPHFVDELHLGCAGIPETGVQPSVDESLEQGLCAIHGCVPSFFRINSGVLLMIVSSFFSLLMCFIFVHSLGYLFITVILYVACFFESVVL
jgi:hypothetical protein